MYGIANAPKNHPFNVRNSTVSILTCASSTFIALSLNDANTLDECTDILLKSVSIGVCGILYEIIVWNTSKLFEFIKSLADTVNESE